MVNGALDMKIKIEFSTDNAAFEDYGFAELEHVCKQIFLRLVDAQDAMKDNTKPNRVHSIIRDSNGNKIGTIDSRE